MQLSTFFVGIICIMCKNICSLHRKYKKYQEFSINLNQKKIMSDVASRVKAIIVDKLSVEESEVTNEASFTNDLGAEIGRASCRERV